MAAKLRIVRNYIGSCMTRYLRRRLRLLVPRSQRRTRDRIGCSWPLLTRMEQCLSVKVPSCLYTFVDGAIVSCPSPPPRPTPLWFSFRSALSPLSLGESNRQSAQWRQACPTTRKRACASGQQALGFRRISRSSSLALSPGPVSSPRRASASAGALVVVAFTSFGTRRTMT